MSPCFKFGARGRTTYPPLDEERARKEVQVYRPLRWVGYMTSMAALAFGLYNVANPEWLYYRSAGM